MTQQAVVTAPVAAAAPAPPVKPAPTASEQGEPTIEELAALVGDPLPEPGAEPEAVVEVEAVDVAEETVDVTPTEADAALERATKAVAKARAGSARYQQTQRMLAEQAQREQRATQEAEQYRREVLAAREQAAAYKADPYKALKDAGMTDAQLAERAMRENTPEALLEQTRQEVAVERAARIALETRIENERINAKRAQQARQAEEAFFDAAKDFPELAVRRPAVQLVAAREALKQIKANGHDPSYFTHAQIAEAAEQWLAIDAGKAKPVVPVVPVAKPVVPKRSDVTLTNKMAQSRTVAPAKWDELSEEQQLAHIAAGLPEPTG